MFESLINAIQAGVNPQVLQVGDRQFTSTKVYEVPKVSTPDPIELKTLDGLLAYVARDPDNLELDNMFLHVVDSTEVVLLLPTIDTVRPCPACANCRGILGNQFSFGVWHSIDTLIIDLQAKFVPTEDLAALLSVIGNITEESVKQFSDDGVTQTVQTRSGVTMKGYSEVPRILKLRPRRTFPEIEQPIGEFVFRVQKGRDGIQGALFESGCANWQAQAIADIATYLRNQLVVHRVEIPVIA